MWNQCSSFRTKCSGIVNVKPLFKFSTKMALRHFGPVKNDVILYSLNVIWLSFLENDLKDSIVLCSYKWEKDENPTPSLSKIVSAALHFLSLVDFPSTMVSTSLIFLLAGTLHYLFILDSMEFSLILLRQ